MSKPTFKMKFTTLLFTLFFAVSSIHSQHNTKETFVIVHGAWGSSANFKVVDSLLTQKNQIVYRPCLTGQGERKHLASPDIGLETHVLDVVNTILYEDLKNIILVGHSYGGKVISKVADSIPERIQKLVFIDASLPNHGESSITIHKGEVEAAKKWFDSLSVNGFINPPIKENWKKPPPNDVPQSYKTFKDTVFYKNKKLPKIPSVFIDCGYKPMAERAKKRGWLVYKLGNDHNVQWSDPVGLTNLLIEITRLKK